MSTSMSTMGSRMSIATCTMTIMTTRTMAPSQRASPTLTGTSIPPYGTAIHTIPISIIGMGTGMGTGRATERKTGVACTRRPLPASDLRELAGRDQLHQQVPLVLLEHGDVARLADPHLLADDLDVGAGATTRGT